MDIVSSCSFILRRQTKKHKECVSCNTIELDAIYQYTKFNQMQALLQKP